MSIVSRIYEKQMNHDSLNKFPVGINAQLLHQMTSGQLMLNVAMILSSGTFHAAPNTRSQINKIGI